MLIETKKNQAPAPAPAPVKAVELSCVTCGGAHSHQNCPATHGNDYRDNISEYVSQAAAANYNQVSSNFRPQMVSNHNETSSFNFRFWSFPGNSVTNPKEDLKDTILQLLKEHRRRPPPVFKSVYPPLNGIECLALADLGAAIYYAIFIWEKLSLPDPYHQLHELELAIDQLLNQWNCKRHLR
ncbi:hypothetical protein Tco_0205511 [Tanacetum coccineum]